jgi:hypothetical protein
MGALQKGRNHVLASAFSRSAIKPAFYFLKYFSKVGVALIGPCRGNKQENN